MTHATEARHLEDHLGRLHADSFNPARASASENQRARYAELITIAAAEMDRLYEQIRGSGYALKLHDAGGASLYETADANLGSMLMIMGIPYDSEEARGISGAITAIMTGVGFIPYLIAWIVMPDEPLLLPARASTQQVTTT